MGRAFKDALYPVGITCDVCGVELKKESRYNLCEKCEKDMPFNNGDACTVCGAPIKNEAEYCIRCMNTESSFKRNAAPLVYDGEAKNLVHKLKFGRKKYLVEMMTAMMSDKFLEEGLLADVIVFVPMTEKEKKQRGFNQSEMLARRLGERLKIPVDDALKKTSETETQRGLSAEERKKNLEKAFSSLGTVKGMRVLLVDDVFTTGATVNECAKALLAAKAKEVSSLTLCVTEQKIYSE